MKLVRLTEICVNKIHNKVQADNTFVWYI